MPREFIHVRRIEFHETDLAGIVHFSNFFRYMEAAEADLFRHLGFSMHSSSDSAAIGWPRGEVSCRFSSPLRFEDQIQVRISLATMSTRTITWQCVIHRCANGDWIESAQGTSTAICTDKGGHEGKLRAIEIPSEIREAITLYFADDSRETLTLPANKL